MRYFLLVTIHIFTCQQAIGTQLLTDDKLERITQQVQQILDRLEAIEARLERLEQSLDSNIAHPSGIIFMDDIDAASIVPFQDAIRDWCGEPKLEISVDLSKNAIIFKNFTSSTAATNAKIKAWIRNAPSGKLRKR